MPSRKLAIALLVMLTALLISFQPVAAIEIEQDNLSDSNSGDFVPQIFRLRAECPHGPIIRRFTGFLIQTAQYRGIMTALHAVAGCNNIRTIQHPERDNRPVIDSLTIDKVDVENDVALLVSRQLDELNMPGLLPSNDDPYLYKDAHLMVYGYPTSYAFQQPLQVNVLRVTLLRELIPDEGYLAPLEARNSPSLQMHVFDIQAEIQPGHSGSPLLTTIEPLGVLGVVDGAIQERGEKAWVIPWYYIQLKDADSQDFTKLASEDAASAIALTSDVENAEGGLTIARELSPDTETFSLSGIDTQIYEEGDELLVYSNGYSNPLALLRVTAKDGQRLTAVVVRQKSPQVQLEQGMFLDAVHDTASLDSWISVQGSNSQEQIELLLRNWDDVHHEADHSLDSSRLESVLTGAALSQQRNVLNVLRTVNCYWEFTDLEQPVIVEWREVSPNDVAVAVRKHWDGKQFCNGQRAVTITNPFIARYRVIRTVEGWRITEKDFDENAMPTVGSTAVPQRDLVCLDTYNTRLQVNWQAFLDHDRRNNVRLGASLDSPLVNQILPGEIVTVVDGPICADDMIWWYVTSNETDVAGWTSEGDADQYWLAPVPSDPNYVPSPEEVVRSFYLAVDAGVFSGNFQTAYDLFSPLRKSRQPYLDFQKGYDTTFDVSVGRIWLLSQETGSAQVRAFVTATDYYKNGEQKTATYDIRWNLVKEAGRWKLDTAKVNVQ